MRSPVKYIIAVFLLFSFLADRAAGQELDGYTSVQDLRSSWSFYSSKEGTYLPFIPANGQETYAVHIEVDLRRFPGEFLIIRYPAKTSTWIGGELINYYENEALVHTSTDSLRQLFRKDVLRLILYNPNRDFDRLATFIGHEEKDWNSYAQLNRIAERKTFDEKDSFLIITLLIISLFTLLSRLFPKDFRDFFNIGSLFLTSTASDDIFKPRTLVKAQMIFLLALSALIAYLLTVYHYYRQLSPLDPLLGESGIIGSWVILTFVAYLIILLKYLLIYLVSILFNISEKINYYFFEIIILSMVFYMALFVLLMGVELVSFRAVEPFIKILVYPVILFYIIRLIILFFKIRSGTSIQNLHLFSYLCSTELLPIVIGLKYFLQ